MSKPAKPAAAPDQVAAPPKSKKMLFIIIGVVLVAVAAGAGWYFTKGHAPQGEHVEEVKADAAHEPKYIALGENFTVNLLHEEGDQYLQAGITLKILDPLLEEKIKVRMPEIKSKLLFLLANKLPSELQTAAGKQKLINDIIAETDAVLGLAAAPVHVAAVAAPETGGHDNAPVADAHAAPADTPHAAPAAIATAPLPHKTTGIVDVLFTSFIIQ